MRMTPQRPPGDPARLEDVSVAQGARTARARVDAALAPETAAVDPFAPGGLAGAPGAPGGIGLRRPGSEESGLAIGLLRGFDGGLPDYLLEALYRGLHAGDAGLSDFLGALEARLVAARFRIEARATLAADLDGQALGPRLTDRLARGCGVGAARADLLALAPVLASRDRALEPLERALAWWSARPTRVRARFDRARPIAPDCRTRLGRGPDRGVNHRLGRGALLGRFAPAPEGRVEIEIVCASGADLLRLEGDAELADGLRAIARRRLGAPCAATVYARLRRGDIPAPRLGGRRAPGARLGRSRRLAPERRPDDTARIALDPDIFRL